jgi:hypothetical protein
MLELRPSCEHCDRDLPPQSTEARICSFECTFCADCVENVLGNVCPNCGGGFERRPVRPARAWKGNAHLGHHPATNKRTHKPVDLTRHATFAAPIRALAAHQR